MNDDLLHLIQSWQEELKDRHRLRENPLSPWTIEYNNIAMFDHYKRAWYYGGRTADFLISLVVNLTNPNLPAAALLQQSSEEFVAAFFKIWALTLAQSAWSTEHLKMLIILFRPEWSHYYQPLLAALSSAELKMLANKTANSHLRGLIEQQLTQEAETKKNTTHLAFASAAKTGLRLQAQENIHAFLQHPQDYASLLTAGENLFAAGDLDEVIWLAHTLSVIDTDPHAAWKEHSLWIRSFSIFALAGEPDNPYGLAEKMNDQLLGRRLDSSLAYMDLAESLAVAMSFMRSFAEVEIHRKVNLLLQLRPEDAALLYFQKHLSLPAQPLDQTLLDLAEEALVADPFTAFMRLEMNRFLLFQGKTMPLPLRHALTGIYRKLHHWLPLSRFWNQDILANLLPAAEHSAYQLGRPSVLEYLAE